MTTRSQTWKEEILEVAGTKLQMVKGGTGEPLLLLHGEMGHPGWLRYEEELSQHHTLYAPSHPGYGESERIDWIMTMRDLGGWYLRALEELGLGPINVVGFSIGGWLAAEMAAMCPHLFKKLVLVGAPGIRPPSGQVFDMFMSTAKEYMTLMLLDPGSVPELQQVLPDEATPEQVEVWEVAREETCRLVWKPYMFDPALPHLLLRPQHLQTLVIWGREDAIVPLSVGEAYRDAIKGSRLVVLDNCGHRPELEKPDELVKLVQEHLSGS